MCPRRDALSYSMRITGVAQNPCHMAQKQAEYVKWGEADRLARFVANTRTAKGFCRFSSPVDIVNHRPPELEVTGSNSAASGRS